MKITRVEFLLCQYPLADPITMSCGILTRRNFGLIRIQTDTGIDGFGETSVNFPPWSFKERAATIEDGLAGLLIGENPLEIGRLWTKMTRAVRGYTRMWSEGALAQAVSGIDIALWDIAGKEYCQPISVLLGGRFREEVEVYATGYSPDQLTTPNSASDIEAKGYRAVKIRIGFDDVSDLENVRRVHDSIGGGVRVIVDANGAYRLPQARKIARCLSEFNLLWLEEPVLADDLEGYVALHQEFPAIPLAWGENAFSIESYQRFAQAHAIDIVMPDPARTGGLTQCARVCENRFALRATILASLLRLRCGLCGRIAPCRKSAEFSDSYARCDRLPPSGRDSGGAL